MSKLFKSLLSVFLAVLMVTSLAAIPSSAATVALNKTSIILAKGYYTTLSVSGTKSTVTWSSDDPDIASVSSAGKVTGKKIGTTYVYAKAGSTTLKCKVRVLAATISVSSSDVSLKKVGDKKTITVTVKGQHDGLKVSTENKNVASAAWASPAKWDGDKINFTITANKKGSTKIKVYLDDYQSTVNKYIYVHVGEPNDSASLFTNTGTNDGSSTTNKSTNNNTNNSTKTSSVSNNEFTSGKTGTKFTIPSSGKAQIVYDNKSETVPAQYSNHTPTDSLPYDAVVFVSLDGKAISSADKYVAFSLSGLANWKKGKTLNLSDLQTRTNENYASVKGIYSIGTSNYIFSDTSKSYYDDARFEVISNDGDNLQYYFYVKIHDKTSSHTIEGVANVKRGVKSSGTTGTGGGNTNNGNTNNNNTNNNNTNNNNTNNNNTNNNNTNNNNTNNGNTNNGNTNNGNTNGGGTITPTVPTLPPMQPVRCDICRGTGDCHICRGTGKINTIPKTTCTSCFGNKKCTYCNGTGYYTWSR